MRPPGRRCAASAAGACQNACPVYRQTGGHAYGSVYAGPIAAILTPQLHHMEAGAVTSLRLIAVRRLLRGLPGTDQHSGGPGSPARARGGEDGTRLPRRLRTGEARHEDDVTDLSESPKIGGGADVARIAQRALVGKDGWIHWLPGMAGHCDRGTRSAAAPHAELP